MIVVITVYRWLLCLYPGSYRHEFGAEMTSVFHEARSALAPALALKISFYRSEFCGLLLGALRAHFDRLFGPAIPFRRFNMQTQFRFPCSTVFLMLVIFAGVVLTIAKASTIVGDTSGSVWPSLISVMVLMLLSMCTAAVVVVGILHTLRRSGVHRLENVQGSVSPAESNRWR
ncbi:MAG: hypothetical protein WBW31_01760 [Candidatus Sulfotelmatobacter sp.]